MSGLDVTADGIAVYPDQDPYFYVDGYDQAGYQGADERFFTASDEELEQWSRGLAKQERKRKNVGLKVLVVFVLLILLAFGAAVFAYTQGYGYPSQETVVKQLFADPSAAKENVIAKDVGDDKAAAMIELVPQDNDVTIDGMDKSMSDSTAYVTADLPEGGQMKYKVSLVRDMIGWKVANVDYYASSQY